MEKGLIFFSVAPDQFFAELRTFIREVILEQQIQTVKSAQSLHKDRPLLKAAEVCSIFQISKPTLYEWLKRGCLKSIKVNSRRYFLWADVDELVSASKRLK